MAQNNIFGRIPGPTTHWKCQKQVAKEGGGTAWATLMAQSPEDADAKVSTFPIGALSVEAIRDTWGAGTYKCVWYGDNGKGAGGLIKVGGPCAMFELEEARTANGPTAVAPPPPVAAAPPPPAPSAASEGMTMISMAAALAREQITMIQMMSAQQVDFVREHARISHQQMSQHYGAMLRVQRQNEAPPAWAQQLGQRVAAIESYEEEEPDANELAAVQQGEPLGGMVTTDGRLSIPHVVQALVQQGMGPKALELLADLTAKAKPKGDPSASPAS